MATKARSRSRSRASARGRSRTRGRAATRRRGESFSYITVRVGLLPGRIRDIALNGGRTVEHAVQGYDNGMDAAGYSIRVNNEPAESSTELSEGDVVLLVGEIEGN